MTVCKHKWQNTDQRSNIWTCQYCDALYTTKSNIPPNDPNDCPNCEYHKKRAQNWRDEAYKQAGHPLPEREWVGLTDDAEIFAISNTMPYANRFEFARAIEAKLKEKNNG